MKPRPQDDEAIGEICRWLKQNKLVALTTLSGKTVLMPAERLYDRPSDPDGRPDGTMISRVP